MVMAAFFYDLEKCEACYNTKNSLLEVAMSKRTCMKNAPSNLDAEAS